MKIKFRLRFPIYKRLLEIQGEGKEKENGQVAKREDKREMVVKVGKCELMGWKEEIVYVYASFFGNVKII